TTATGSARAAPRGPRRWISTCSSTASCPCARRTPSPTASRRPCAARSRRSWASPSTSSRPAIRTRACDQSGAEARRGFLDEARNLRGEVGPAQGGVAEVGGLAVDLGAGGAQGGARVVELAGELAGARVEVEDLIGPLGLLHALLGVARLGGQRDPLGGAAHAGQREPLGGEPVDLAHLHQRLARQLGGGAGLLERLLRRQPALELREAQVDEAADLLVAIAGLVGQRQPALEPV